MTAQLDTAWKPRAQALADELESRGDLTDPAWKAAVAATPRHVFVPEVYEQDTNAEWRPVDVTSPSGLNRVYSPTTLVTALADRGTHSEGISSSTKPDLMVRMLEALDVHNGHKVLEIGTGTGYNAGLLSHRLGDEQVFSVDLDAELVDPARDRLASIGLHPTLVTRDGAEGLQEHAPFDRIIATCSVPTMPRAWCEQLEDGGLLLADIQLGVGAGNLALLRRDGDQLEGRFTDRWAAFMLIRHHNERPRMLHAPADAGARTRTTSTPPNPWQDNRVVWFLAHLMGLPPGVRYGMRFDPDTRQPTAGTITAPDGSHAFVMLEPTPNGTWSVTETGPTPLWAAVERAQRQWREAGEPGWTRIGLTVTPDDQVVWIDQPTSEHQWSLTA
ncbi:protein-L-isoaspartate(D-aspartate) O-methyltransferase [Saccharopolyspora shandongensis]|uniref:Protein-L-isoaspartate O-methyltransferase n=1 Tax=Saccharopolyspora shandongensis TaxID=418495 RepID=A0A1H3T506_9PSEU|nr:methyltransferase domain-containing protein [Saccharopolyspora shandongensis]SDZ44941.1 protein-L-isoaspartate(D-aspartate) O-methyltransferase [Saccharopolyspora shandongensis]